MAKIERVDHYGSEEIYGYQFICPGCNDHHMPVVNNKQPGGPQWTFNGDLNSPTFTPSLLMRYETYQGEGKPMKRNVCHSFIRDGKIEFLNDCTHTLAGQTLEMPEVEDGPENRKDDT